MILYYTNENRRNNIKIYRRYDPTDRAVVAFIIKTFQNDRALRCSASALPLQRIPIIYCRRSESLLLFLLKGVFSKVHNCVRSSDDDDDGTGQPYEKQ